VPLAGALVWLAHLSEEAFLAGHAGLANFIGVLRIALYWAWCLPTWKVSPNALARAALIAGLVVTVLT
jgi:hypothetical protein